MTIVRILFFFAFCAFSQLFAVAQIEADSREVLSDVNFERGFVLTGPKHDSPSRNELFPGSGKEKPAWRITQWNSQGMLDRISVDEKNITLSDSCKTVQVEKSTGEITLSIAGAKEYERPRKSAAEPWAHLLLEQPSFEKPIRIADVKSIFLELEFELLECTQHGEPDPALHAAQFSWFVYLKNKNPDSKGFHDFLWFGLGIFDSRHEFVPLYAAQDFAVPEGKFIYSLGGRSFLEEKIVPKKAYKIKIDILPELKTALKTAQGRGFLENSRLEEMELDGTNIGWEIPGVIDASIRIRKISLMAYPKK